MKEIIATILAIVLAVLVIFLLTKESDRTKELEVTNNEIEIQTSSYQQEKRALEIELEALKANVIQKESGVGSLILVFSDINEQFSQEILPKLNDHKLNATLCITENSLPVILNENIGIDINTLLDSGWQMSLYWDGSDDISTWFDYITNLLNENGISIPKLLCVDYSNYVPSLDNTAASLGFTDMIVNFGNSYITLDNFNSKLNIINGHSWYTTASSTALASLNFVDSQLAFFVGTQGDELAYETEQFSAMLTTALSKQEDGKIIITTPVGSRKQIEINEEEYKKAIEGYDEKVYELEAAIAELDTKINKIYSEHFDSN